MTATEHAMPASGREAWKLGFVAMLRSALSVTVLTAAYFLMPTRRADEGSDVGWLVLELCVFGVVVAIQVPAIIMARFPILRAVESLALLVPLYLLIFARIYLSSSLGDPSVFTQPLTLVSALYFTVTVFASVGFGDILAQSDGMRLLVTFQMLLNLVVLGLVIKLLTSAARRGVALRAQQPAAEDVGERDDA